MAGLRGRVVLVTNACSTVGRATAIRFAKSGAKLALVNYPTLLRKHLGDLERRDIDDDPLENAQPSQYVHPDRVHKECVLSGATHVHHLSLEEDNIEESSKKVVEQILDRFRGKRLTKTTFKCVSCGV